MSNKGTTLIIGLLNKCKKCSLRQEYHNQLADLLSQEGIEQVGMTYGMIRNQQGIEERYEPLEEYDALCRKADDPMNYTAPVYILQTDMATIKLEDIANYPNPIDYANYVCDVLDSLNEKLTS